MKQFIRDYFTFNRRERRGVFVLLCIIALLLLYLHFAPFLVREKVDFMLLEKGIEKIRKDSSASDSFDSNKVTPRNWKYPKRTDNRITGNSYYQNKDKYSYKEEYVKEKLWIELNTADSTLLEKLKGIGPTFARRIVKYRDLLGGFCAKEQLMEVYGFDSLKWSLVCENVYIDVSKLRKMNINVATMDELKKHPYIKYPLARVIVNYRLQHGLYKSIENLRGIDLMNDELYMRLSPYLITE